MNPILNIYMDYSFNPGGCRLKYHLMSRDEVDTLWQELPSEHLRPGSRLIQAEAVEDLVRFDLRNWLDTLSLANVQHLYTHSLNFCEASSIRFSKLGLIDMIVDDAVAVWHAAEYHKKFVSSPKRMMRKFAKDGVLVDGDDHITVAINALLIKKDYELVLHALPVLGKADRDQLRPVTVLMPAPEAATAEPTTSRLVADAKREAASGNACNECTICCEREADSVLLPCRHISNCYECNHTWLSGNDQLCPICRQEIHQLVKVYRS
jgi:hypothetical protein